MLKKIASILALLILMQLIAFGQNIPASIATCSVSWDAPAAYTDGSPLAESNISQYDVFRSRDYQKPVEEWAKIQPVNSPQKSFEDNRLLPNYNYYYSIKAVDKAGTESAFSSLTVCPAPIDCRPDAERQCGSNGSGICSFGLEKCSASGQWTGVCIGEIIPKTEICGNNLDDDCDGSIDNGCACPVEGETRECGSSNVGACKLGIQTCSNNVWSSCVGSIEPGLEVCGNNQDDDCDGTVDGLACVTQEICNNGIDDDGNGKIDESPCISIEVCGNQADDNNDGEIDEGCLPDLVPELTVSNVVIENGLVQSADIAASIENYGTVADKIFKVRGYIDDAQVGESNVPVSTERRKTADLKYERNEDSSSITRETSGNGISSGSSTTSTVQNTANSSNDSISTKESGNGFKVIYFQGANAGGVIVFKFVADADNQVVESNEFNNEAVQIYNTDTNGFCDTSTGENCEGIDTCALGVPGPDCAEVCDGIDNNDDGSVDESITEDCGSGNSVGICSSGTETCIVGGWTECTAVEPMDEVCDGMDNDCDGTVDNGLENCNPPIPPVNPENPNNVLSANWEKQLNAGSIQTVNVSKGDSKIEGAEVKIVSPSGKIDLLVTNQVGIATASVNEIGEYSVTVTKGSETVEGKFAAVSLLVSASGIISDSVRTFFGETATEAPLKFLLLLLLAIIAGLTAYNKSKLLFAESIKPKSVRQKEFLARLEAGLIFFLLPLVAGKFVNVDIGIVVAILEIGATIVFSIIKSKPKRKIDFAKVDLSKL